MKKAAVPLALAICTLSFATKAQVTIDMTKMTCDQYLALSPTESRVISAWMSGWFNQKIDKITVDLAGYQRNVASLKTWCSSNLKDSVMAGLQRSIPAK